MRRMTSFQEATVNGKVPNGGFWPVFGVRWLFPAFGGRLVAVGGASNLRTAESRFCWADKSAQRAKRRQVAALQRLIAARGQVPGASAGLLAVARNRSWREGATYISV